MSAAREPRQRALYIAAALGAANLAWALFLWWELIDLRRGGDVFCAFGDSCATAWTSAEAKWVESATGLPIAGWGAAWSVAALALPLLASMRRDADRPADPFWSASVSVGLAGVFGVVGLIALSTALGLVCASCVVTYVGVAAYGFVTVREGLSHAPVSMPHGAGTAAVAFAAAFGLASIPAYALRPADFDLAAASRADAGDADETALVSFLREVPAPVLQQISDAVHLDRLRGDPGIPERAPRGLMGSPNAPVRLTEFVDLLCGHCADFHGLLKVIRRRIGPERLAIEPRYFPLDGRCNRAIRESAPNPVRCTAAKALICSAGEPYAFDLSGKLFAAQRTLDDAQLYEIAAEYVSQADLRRCVESPETAAALAEDVEWAIAHQIRGTPHVLLNGRTTAAREAALFALLLAEGDLEHEAFAVLPPPSPERAPHDHAHDHDHPH